MSKVDNKPITEEVERFTWDELADRFYDVCNDIDALLHGSAPQLWDEHPLHKELTHVMADYETEWATQRAEQEASDAE